MVGFCDLLGTPYASVSKIPSVKWSKNFEMLSIAHIQLDGEDMAWTIKVFRDVPARATSATAVAPKFSDILTLFHPGRGQILPQHCRGRTRNFPVVNSLVLVTLIISTAMAETLSLPPVKFLQEFAIKHQRSSIVMNLPKEISCNQLLKR